MPSRKDIQQVMVQTKTKTKIVFYKTQKVAGKHYRKINKIKRKNCISICHKISDSVLYKIQPHVMPIGLEHKDKEFVVTNFSVARACTSHIRYFYFTTQMIMP
jgi:hypothetical protein